MSLRCAAGNLRCSSNRQRRRTRYALSKRFTRTTAASQFTKRVCHLAHPPACCSALLGTARRGRREPNAGCAQIAPLAFNSSKLGAAAAHRDCLDSAFDPCFASTAKMQTLFQKCELLARTLPASAALLTIKVPAPPQN